MSEICIIKCWKYKVSSFKGSLREILENQYWFVTLK